MAAVWSVAFAIKFTASFFGDELYQLNVHKDNDFWQAAYLAVFTLITEILPVFLVVDGSFVKIFSAEHLEATIGEEVDALLGAHLSKETIQTDSLVITDPDGAPSSGPKLVSQRLQNSAEAGNSL